MRIEIHTLQWKDDKAQSDQDSEPAGANLYCIVLLDGVRYDNVVSTKVESSSDFAETWIQFIGDTSITSHTIEEWEKLFGPRYPAQGEKVLQGLGHLIALADDDPQRSSFTAEDMKEFKQFLVDKRKREREQFGWESQAEPCSGSGYSHGPHGACPGYTYDRT